MADFSFSNLLGAPYRGGTLLLQDNWLFSPVGNRVTRVRALPGGNSRHTARRLTPEGCPPRPVADSLCLRRWT